MIFDLLTSNLLHQTLLLSSVLSLNKTRSLCSFRFGINRRQGTEREADSIIAYCVSRRAVKKAAVCAVLLL